MKNLTIFSSPKPFNDPHIAAIQRNAIRSWCQLGEQVEVILIGDEQGMAETAREFGLTHIPGVACNDQGTPLVSSIFSLARENGSSPILAYINADILTLSDFLSMAQRMLELASEFILVGQRWDLDILVELEFSSDWEKNLRQSILERGKLHPPAGSDYFVFPRTCYQELPDFAIGRAGWDNWMIYQARKQGWLAVDATRSITIAHQQHDYSHLPGGKPHYKLPETNENIRLAGGREITRFSLLDADRRLVMGRLRSRRYNWDTIRRMVETFPLLVMNNYQMTKKITNLFHRLKYMFNRPEVDQ
ncbi:hypothetical protein ACFLTX_03525 [Chloroflexota bacterium]